MGLCMQFAAGFFSALGAFCLGTVIGWSGPVEMEVKEGRAYDFKPTTVEWGLTGSLMTLGAAFSCIPVGILIQIIGRKKTMLCLAPPLLLGWLMILYAPHIGVLIFARFVVGFSGGAFCVAAPMYNMEIAEVKFRGIMGCFFQLLIVIGILYAFFVGAFLRAFWLTAVSALWPIIFFLIFLCMPESPVYLAQMGQTEKAEKVLKNVRDKNEDVSAELKEMVAEGTKEKGSLRKILCRSITLKGLGISIMLMLFQQFTGINAIIFYATYIFTAAGSDLQPRYSTIVVGVVQLGATLVSLVLIDRIGRKLLLLASAFLMGISTLTMSLFFGFLKDQNYGWVALLAVCVFIIGFSLGFGPIPWVMMGELFAEDAKALAGSIAGTTNWIFAFIVTMLFPILNEVAGPTICFAIFAGFAIAAFLFIIFLVPETKGKTLNEIQAKLGEKKE
ncbi:hypothetical protein KR009_010156 [Drosophila setifemur]|nr:hypothetical protein KR009_010156 [Drosophila setifemur]